MTGAPLAAPVHVQRDLGRTVARAVKRGTPMRHARATVVSSTIGTTVVTPDGGTTQVTVYNYSHTQSLPAGTVVDVLFVGAKGYVLGAYTTPAVRVDAPQTVAAGTWTAGLAPRLAGGYAQVTTNGAGVATFTYPKAFTAYVATFLANLLFSSGSQPVPWTWSIQSIGLGSAWGTLLNTENNTTVPNTLVGFTWMAVGA